MGTQTPSRYPKERYICMVTFKLQTTLWSGLLIYSPGEETDAQEENTVLSVAQWEDKGINI